MNKKYQFDDFYDYNTWLIFRMDAFLEDKVADIYVVMDLPSGMILALDITETELSQRQVDALLEKALLKNSKVPRQILLAKNDPVELFLEKSTKKWQVKFETAPALCLEDLTEEVKRSFYKAIGLPTTRDRMKDDADDSDYENAKRSIPDSYDFCSCASGLKYKFCCKRIFREIVNAMIAAEEGRFEEALEWIAKARKLVGNTSEVLCRESIVYSFFDAEKSEECLKKCLEVNAKHPRVYYIKAIALAAEGDFEAAVKAYETAISYYPSTDHYHLNEVHNNLGSVYYQMGDYVKAKSEWEIALKFLPSDKLTQRNLQNFIYKRKMCFADKH